jgi:hypothetical protein
MSRKLVTSEVRRPRKTLGKVGTVADIAVQLGVSPQYIYQQMKEDENAPTEWAAKFGTTYVYDVEEFARWYSKKRLASVRRRANHTYKGLI